MRNRLGCAGCLPHLPTPQYNIRWESNLQTDHKPIPMEAAVAAEQQQQGAARQQVVAAP